MHTTRTLVVLEAPVREAVYRIARKEHVSVSHKCRDLIREALELEEDAYWNRTAAGREKSAGKKWIPHKKAWGR